MLDLQLKQGTGLGVLKTLAARDAAAARQGHRVHELRVSRSTATAASPLGADYFFDKSREFHRVRDVLADLADGELDALTTREAVRKPTPRADAPEVGTGRASAARIATQQREPRRCRRLIATPGRKSR